HALLDVLLSLQEKSPVKFDLIAVNLDQKQPGFPAHVLPEYLTRRGVLYRVASELGATRIALGHHRDDILATFFLNLFHGGKLKAMPPKLVSDDGKHVVIRPLAYVCEQDLIEFSKIRAFPIIPCTLCGSQENLERKKVGEMLAEWQRRHPG